MRRTGRVGLPGSVDGATLGAASLRITKKLLATAARGAASDPTGHEQQDGQSSVAWLRKKQSFSRRVGAGSATSERYPQ